jgi:hypothetical protein
MPRGGAQAELPRRQRPWLGTLQTSLVVALCLLLGAGLLAPGGRIGAAGVGAPSAAASFGTPGTAVAARPGPPLAATVVAIPPATPRSSGTLSAVVAGPLRLPPVRLTGQDQVVAFPVPITVTDMRGDQGGWQLRLTLNPLVLSGPTAHQRASVPATVTAVTAACVAASCTLPAPRLALPVCLDPTQATAIYQAAPGTGQGTLTITAIVKVVVPASAYTGSYRVTATVAILPAPSHAEERAA